MRKILLLFFATISLSSIGQSRVPYKAMMNYLKKHESLVKDFDEDICPYFNICNVENEYPEDTIVKKVGVYYFKVNFTHTNTYLLLKSRNSYRILNVKDVDRDAIKLAKFLDKNSKVLSREYKLECFRILFHIAPGNKYPEFRIDKMYWLKKWFLRPNYKDQVKYYLNYKEKD